jgi:hypothetical protein
VRGAVSCGEFFADKPNQIFLGRALVEALEYGERYNWIGFTLSLSAEQQLKQFGLQLPMLNYRKWEAEFVIKQSYQKEPVWVYPIGAEAPQNGQNIYISFLRGMAEKYPDYARKYQNTIDFLESCGVWMPVKNDTGASNAHNDCEVDPTFRPLSAENKIDSRGLLSWLL